MPTAGEYQQFSVPSPLRVPLTVGVSRLVTMLELNSRCTVGNDRNVLAIVLTILLPDRLRLEIGMLLEGPDLAVRMVRTARLTLSRVLRLNVRTVAVRLNVPQVLFVRPAVVPVMSALARTTLPVRFWLITRFMALCTSPDGDVTLKKSPIVPYVPSVRSRTVLPTVSFVPTSLPPTFRTMP